MNTIIRYTLAAGFIARSLLVFASYESYERR